MFLHAIRVENFRAIGYLSMTFDRTTVLIGQNDTGRSTLFEALDVVLGVERLDRMVTFETTHVPRQHRRGDGGGSEIAVALTRPRA